MNNVAFTSIELTVKFILPKNVYCFFWENYGCCFALTGFLKICIANFLKLKTLKKVY